MKIEFEGKRLELPDDFTPEEVEQAVLSLPQPADWWKTIKAIPGTALGQAQKSVGGALRALGEGEIGGLPNTNPVIGTLVNRGLTTMLGQGEGDKAVAEAGAGIAESGTENIKEAHPGEMSFWKRAVLSGTSSAAAQVPGLALSVATKSPVPAVAAATGMTGGSTYAENREAKIEPSRAATHAKIDMAAEAALEWLPTKFLLDNQAKSIFGMITGFMAREVPTEVLTTAIQSANAKFSTRPEMTWEEYGQDLLDTVGSTMVSGPIVGGAARVLDRTVGEKGDDKSQLSTPSGEPVVLPKPSFDQPSVTLDSKQNDEIAKLIASIDADLLDDNAVVQAQETLKKHEEAKKANPAAEAEWLGFAAAPEKLEEDASELGATAKQAANAKNYINPNTGDRLDRQFLYGPEATEGLPMRAVRMQPATYTLGKATEDRSAEYLRAVHDTVEQWRQKYMPNATVVVSNEQLATNSALGSHYLVMPGQHLIVPAVLRSPSKGLGAFNANTQASAFYNLTHEFGHGIVKEHFFTGVAPDVALQVVRESEAGLVSPEALAKLPAVQQAVISEFNAIKAAVGSNQMSAKEFVDVWMSPAKGQGRKFLSELGLQDTDNAMDVVKAVVARASKKANITDGSKVRAFREAREREFLSLDEYLAEQTARYAYKTKWDQQSPLGSFFKQALDSLRKFFAELKKDKLIQPGTAFTEWIEGLNKGDRALTQGERTTAGKKKGGTPAKVEGTATVKTKKPAAPKKKVEKVEHNVDTSTTEGKQAKGRLLIGELIRNGTIENVKSELAQELYTYLKHEDWAEFVDLYKRLAGKSIKLQLDPSAASSGHVGIKTDIKALIEVFGLNMYTGDVPGVLMKELVQNSFDAVKTQLYNKRQKKGTINVTVNQEERTITVADNGVGMDKETLLKAFLTYPGTSKADLPMEHRSGGLGQAKQVLLFTPESIHVETVKNGNQVILDATPQQLLDGTATLVEHKGVNDGSESGTIVTVKLPATVERGGVQEKVEIPQYTFNYDILENPPLYPGVEITHSYIRKNYQQAPESIPSLLETHRFFKKVQTDWGYVDIYVGQTHTGEYAGYAAKHRVMSSGAWQFNTAITLPFSTDRLPMDLIFDIHSSVPGQHGAYPFTPNRQEIKKSALEEMSKAVKSIVDEYYKELLKKHIEAYTKVLVINENGQLTPPEFTVSQDKDGTPLINFTRGVKPPAFYYNSTNKDYTAVPGAPQYIAELAGIYRQFMDLYSKNHNPKGLQYSVGIGFDRGEGKNKRSSGWNGLHFTRPFHSVWLNPVYMDEANDPVRAAAMAAHLMFHETMHINARSHDAAAFWEIATMYAKLEGTPEMAAIKAALTQTFTNHWETHGAIKSLYDAADTTTVGDTIKGDAAERQRHIDLIENSRDDVREGGELSGPEADARGPWRNTSFELDVSEHPAQRKWLNGLKNFVSDFPRLRRSVRAVQNAVYHVVELQQLAHLNPDLDELALMNEYNGRYNRYKSRLQASADAVLSQWDSLGKENFSRVQKFLFDEVESKQLWFKLEKAKQHSYGWYYKYTPDARALEEFQKRGIDEETAALIIEAKNVLLNQLDEAEIALVSLLSKRYGNAPQNVLMSAMVPVRRHIQELRKIPFFPQGRFGNRMLIVEEKKTDGPGWEIVWREHFEDPVEWEKAWKSAVSKADGVQRRVRKENLSDQHYVLMALPTDFVDMAASELGLSDEQLEILMNILQPVKRDRVLGAYDQQRLGIKGYSTDAMRSFANFTWHNSNLLAKLTYRADFNMTIRGIGVKLREAKYAVTPESLREVERLEHVKAFMEKTRDYVMAPPNEAQQLRAAVSIGYLGLNVKTAILNTYGLITTWSDLTTRLGQVEGNKLFAKASLETFQSLKLTNLNERREGSYLSPEHQQALDRALEEGVLSQSYAYHLAGMANAGNLQRLRFYKAGGRVIQNGIDLAMYVFRLTELSTRRASFLAEFEAARKQPDVSFEEAYQEAVSRTNKLQNDYSLGNRVPFMRGIKAGNENIVGKVFEPVVPLATVFMSFAQHMAFHSYGGYELGERRMAQKLGETPRNILGGYTMKLWIVTLLLAGYEGLPGAENLIDLLELAWRKWGGSKPIRQELRETVQALEIDPQLAARGLGHNIAGFDVSRSVGFGRFVPGTDLMSHPRNDPEEQLGSLILDLAGPTGGFIKFGLEALYSNKGSAKAFERLPGGAGNIYVAYRWSQNGVEAPTGAKITHDLQTGQLRDLTADEILGKALGFNPTVVSQNREIRFNQYDRKVYWQTRRKMVLDDLWTARNQKDREAEADAKKAIIEYNIGVPSEHRELRLTAGDIARSMQTRQREKRFDEKQSTSQKKYRRLYEDVKESYGRP